MNIIDLLLSIFTGSHLNPEKMFGEITPELLEAKKLKLGHEEYRKWLRRKTTALTSLQMELQDRRKPFPAEWQEKLDLLTKAREEAERYG